MVKFVIRGGKELRGQVKVGGAKNSVLKLMAASLLAETPSSIGNAPKITDVFIMKEVLEHLGAEVNFQDHKLFIKPTIRNFETPYELVSLMRASVIVLGPLVGRLGRARVARPGGCNIGRRKIDLHLKGLSQLGVEIRINRGYIEAEAKRIKGARIFLEFPSVGATENLIMASVLAKGETVVIDNAAREPEIVDLCHFLQAMGADIEGVGEPTLVIRGVDSLTGVDYEAIPDRIEAGTFLIAGAITGGEVYVTNANPEHLELFLMKMEEAGLEVESGGGGISIRSKGFIKPIDLATFPYPGFPTDLQPQTVALLALAEGVSVVTENIFENRFLYVDELNRLGANIEVKSNRAIINGVKALYGAPTSAPDLRGGAALVIASLAAQGNSEVLNVAHIDRGYEGFEKKLKGLGALIERVKSEEEGGLDETTT
jgi:UDP-N-acetylglucosamine 1-carboxyvinyltransferase